MRNKMNYRMYFFGSWLLLMLAADIFVFVVKSQLHKYTGNLSAFLQLMDKPAILLFGMLAAGLSITFFFKASFLLIKNRKANNTAVLGSADKLTI
ncbi:hypothetical protein ACYSNR_02940 [Enterococcus sp. LJL128]|uniref:hypothetical protein n=1 Tax=Enterococcus sp. LJL51 TaxID=3416656 RepID=UPI003CEE0DBC